MFRKSILTGLIFFVGTAFGEYMNCEFSDGSVVSQGDTDMTDEQVQNLYQKVSDLIDRDIKIDDELSTSYKKGFIEMII